MTVPMLPGGSESLLATIQAHPHCRVEPCGGFVRLRGAGVEGRTFYECVFRAIEPDVPDTVTVNLPPLSPRDAAYYAIVRRRDRGELDFGEYDRAIDAWRAAWC